MFSISSFSSAPYCTLEGGTIYASALFSSNVIIESNPIIRLLESAQFDCFANFEVSLYPIRQINVYYTVYVTTDKNHTMTLNTNDLEVLYRASDYTSNFYVSTDLNYQLALTQSLDLLLYAVKETQDGF